MFELKRGNFEIVRCLLKNPEEQYIEVLSVLTGNCPGWVFVDNSKTPSAVLIWVQGTEDFLLAVEDMDPVFPESFTKTCRDVILPRLKKAGCRHFKIAGNSEKCNGIIKVILKEYNLKYGKRQCLKCPGITAAHSPIAEPVGFELVKVDMDLFEKVFYSNKHFLIQSILRSWGSIEKFLKAGTGYCVTKGSVIAGIGHSGPSFDRSSTVYVETLEEYRRLGISECILQKLVKDNSKQEKTVYFNTVSENTASLSLAQKMGFKKHFEQAYFYYDLD